jgi:hypothetical protein
MGSRPNVSTSMWSEFLHGISLIRPGMPTSAPYNITSSVFDTRTRDWPVFWGNLTTRRFPSSRKLVAGPALSWVVCGLLMTRGPEGTLTGWLSDMGSRFWTSISVLA